MRGRAGRDLNTTGAPGDSLRQRSLATTLFPPQVALHPKSAHQYLYCALQGVHTVSGRFGKSACSNSALQIGPSRPKALKRPCSPAHPSCLRHRVTPGASAAALLLGRRTVCQIFRRRAPSESEVQTRRNPPTAPGARQPYLVKSTQNRVPRAPEVSQRWSFLPPPHLPFDGMDMGGATEVGAGTWEPPWRALPERQPTSPFSKIFFPLENHLYTLHPPKRCTKSFRAATSIIN